MRESQSPYFDVLRPEDRVAVKPHASPILHAIEYVLGRQTREKLERFRALHGAQAYPSRTKDACNVDFSTGSVGLGVAMTTCAAMVRDYLRARSTDGVPSGRMIAVAGDAEFDEGNVFEALLEGWKHDVSNLWWIFDYNRQSLDAVVPDLLARRFDAIFRDMGWRVVTLKYGKLLAAAFRRRGGDALRDWIDDCSNARYSWLAYRGGCAWREHLLDDIGEVAGIHELLDEHDDTALHRLMTNLGGHDLATVLDAFHDAGTSDEPTCFLAYTIKGYGLPFAGHKDNHSGLMSPQQIDALKRELGIATGAEWDRFSGTDEDSELLAFVEQVPIRASRATGEESHASRFPHGSTQQRQRACRRNTRSAESCQISPEIIRGWPITS